MDGCVNGESDAIDLIRLQAPGIGTLYSLNGTGDDNNITGDIDIVQAGVGSGLEIRGEASISINEMNADFVGQDALTDRVFDVNTTSPVKLARVTIQNGDPPGTENGGGIRLSASTPFTLEFAQVADNITDGSGGGVYMPTPSGLGGINIFDSVIGGPEFLGDPEGNTARLAGGGVYTEASILLNRSSVQGNLVSRTADAVNHSLAGGGLDLRANSGMQFIATRSSPATSSRVVNRTSTRRSVGESTCRAPRWPRCSTRRCRRIRRTR